METRGVKVCTKCKIEKESGEFSKVVRYKSGLASSCKQCHLEYRIANREKKKAYDAKYKLENADNIKAKSLRYSVKNREAIREKSNKYYQKNKDKCLDSNRKYKINNREKRNKSEVNRSKNDIQYRLSNNLRKRLNIAIRNKQKSGSAVSDLGCSIDFLKKHLESKFQESMSWENYGKKGWHIDHIKPLNSFNLENREEFLEACNYENLQPLWAKDNLSKGSKINWKQGEIK